MIERTEMFLFESLVTLLEAKNIVEIGVAHGDGTMYLCNGAMKTGGHVFGYDIWEKHGQLKQFRSYSNKEKVEKKLTDAGFNNFTLTKIDSIGQKEELKELIKKHCPDGIDFAFVDGDHSYRGIKNDFSIVYPLMKSTGVIVFHDTYMIDGCREFVYDLRTKYFDGSFDVVDFPFGCHSNRKIGITLLVKRSFALLDHPIFEVCGTPSSLKQIEENEVKWLNNEFKTNKKDMETLLNSEDLMSYQILGHVERKKFED